MNFQAFTFSIAYLFNLRLIQGQPVVTKVQRRVGPEYEVTFTSIPAATEGEHWVFANVAGQRCLLAKILSSGKLEPCGGKGIKLSDRGMAAARGLVAQLSIYQKYPRRHACPSAKMAI